MADVITALTTGLTPAAFFAVIEDTVPFIIVLVPVSLGMMFLRKLIKGASKAKVKV